MLWLRVSSRAGWMIRRLVEGRSGAGFLDAGAWRRGIRWLAVFCFALLAACQRDGGRPIPQDAYIWQRVWTDALRGAVAESAADLNAVRVLAAETADDGRLLAFAYDAAALTRTAKPVTIVVRIDGATPRWDHAAMIKQLVALTKSAQAKLPRLAGVEIDFDCATARLKTYAEFLAALRARLPAQVALSLTALPTWMGSSALTAVLASVDQVVLQVHGVSDPERGLFDENQAYQWVERFSKQTSRPFLVALPTYGYWLRDIDSATGRSLIVEAEAPSRSATESGRELFVDPRAVRVLTERLRKARFAHLIGIIWFRIPVAGDRRAWSRATWNAMLTDAPLVETLQVQARAGHESGLSELVVTNTGNLDTTLPRRIIVNSPCSPADGVAGYRMMRDGDTLTLERIRPPPIAAGASQIVGWMRCKERMIGRISHAR